MMCTLNRFETKICNIYMHVPIYLQREISSIYIYIYISRKYAYMHIQLRQTRRQVWEYFKRYQTRLHGRNVYYIKQLLAVLQCCEKYLSHVSRTKAHTQTKKTPQSDKKEEHKINNADLPTSVPCSVWSITDFLFDVIMKYIVLYRLMYKYIYIYICMYLYGLIDPSTLKR